MRKSIATLAGTALIACHMLSAAGQQDGLIFHASYDKGFYADSSKGEPRGAPPQELNLEVLKTYLRKGMTGNAALIGVTGAGGDRKAICYTYDAANNLQLEKGTISFWLNPLDWSGTDKNFHIIFRAEGKDSLLLIYKYINCDELLFLLGPKEKNAAGENQWSTARTSVKDWKPGRWSFVACAWDADGLRLYVDGALRNQQPIKIFPKTTFTDFGVGGTSPTPWEGAAGSSLIDQLNIYDLPLSAERIYAEWLKGREESDKGRVTIAMGKTTPSIDGKVEAGEYAFGGTGFFNLKGTLASVQSRYFLSYDADNLYVGVVSPVLEPFLAAIDARDGSLWLDDSVEILLAPPELENSYYHFIINSKGVMFDEKKNDVTWNAAAPLTIKNNVANGMWTFEAAIPYKNFNVPSPANGAQWRVNVCRSFPGMSLFTTISPVRESYSDCENFVRLVLMDRAPVINFESIGEPRSGELNVKLSMVNPTETEQSIAALVRLLSDGQQIVDFSKIIILEKGGKAELPFAKSGLPKTGTVEVKATSQAGDATYYAGSFPYSPEAPAEVTSVYTDIKKQILKIGVKHNNSLSATHPVSLRARLVDKEGKAAAEKTIIPEKLIYEAELPIEAVAPGHYDLVVNLLDEGGKKLFDHVQPFAKPTTPAAWAGNTIGKGNSVPAPWTPLAVENDAIRCWGREYAFDHSLLPTQITTQGQKLFSAPMRLTVKAPTNGFQLERGKADIAEAQEACVTRRFSSPPGTIQASSRIRVEYDGFMWIDLELTTTSPVPITGLAIDMPFVPGHATLVHSLRKGYAYREKGSGLVPKDGWRKDLFEKPIFWVGDEDVGLEWFAENLAGWSVADHAKSVEILPGEKETVIRLNLIDHPTTLEGVRKISFGLQATPVRGKRPDWRQMRIGKNVQTWFPYTKLFNYPDKSLLIDDYQKQLGWYKNLKLCYYNAIYGVTPFSPEWPYWASEWENIPPPKGTIAYKEDRSWACAWVCMNAESYRDFYLWKLSDTIKGLGIKHLYFDLGVPRACHNPEHGCGWLDDQGRLRDSYNILGTRELAKRIYILMKQVNPEAIICNHMSEEPAMPVLAFADLMVDGELYCQQVAEDESYHKVFTPDMFRAEFMSRQWGPPSCFIPQFARSSQLYRPDRMKFWETPEAQKPINHFIGYMFVHDALCWPGFGVKMDAIWKIQDEFGWSDDLTFLPYWDKNSPVRLAAPASDKILVSAYCKPQEKLMIVALNDSDKDEQAVIAIDRQKLRLDGAGVTSAKNAIDGSTVELKDNTLRVVIPARSFKLFVIPAKQGGASPQPNQETVP